MQEKGQKISPIKQRILQIADTLGISRRDFYKQIGVSRGTLESKTGITEDIMAKFIAAFPEVSVDWLVTGEGEIYRTKSTENVTIEKSNKQGNNLGNKPKVQKMLPNEEVRVITLDTSGTEVIPIVDISAAAGAGAFNPDYVETLDTIRLPSRMLHRGPHNCIRIAGDSMAPTMQDGSYVISRLLDRSEWEYIKTGYIYVVTTRDGQTRIKRLRNRLRGKGFIVCTSDNPDKEHFNNFNIDGSEISAVWEVEWYLSARIPNIHDTYYSRMQTLIDDVDDLKAAVEKLLQKPRKKPV